MAPDGGAAPGATPRERSSGCRDSDSQSGGRSRLAGRDQGSSYPRHFRSGGKPASATRLRGRPDYGLREPSPRGPLDAAGNAFLSHLGLYVWVIGRRNPIADQQTKERVRAFQPSGLKLIFALLSQPDLVEADYRTLAKITDTALGTVHLVLRDLGAQNYVHRIGRTRRILLRPKELLEAWVQPFVRDLRPRLLLGRFSSSNTDWWQQIDICKYDSRWGGEPAGATLTGFLKPGTLTIYADKLPATLLVHQRLTRDEKGRVEILKKFWSFSESNAAVGLVPSILAYADLLAIGDARTLETAERLFEEQIDGPFQAYLARTAG
jgi:hypothetical protein